MVFDNGPEKPAPPKEWSADEKKLAEKNQRNMLKLCRKVGEIGLLMHKFVSKDKQTAYVLVGISDDVLQREAESRHVELPYWGKDRRGALSQSAHARDRRPY